MRALILSVLLGVATLGSLAITPSTAEARWRPGWAYWDGGYYPTYYWRGYYRPGRWYNYPRYYYGYYPTYYGSYYYPADYYAYPVYRRYSIGVATPWYSGYWSW